MDCQSGQKGDKTEAMRINKYLAESGLCSRRKADDLIEKGRVKIGTKIAKLGSQVEPGDTISVDDKILKSQRKDDIIIAFHKPIGVICTFEPGARNTLADWIDAGERIFHIGRLDVASSGLLLLTNNGEIAEAITHPRENHEKEYVVTVNRPVTRKFLDDMREGMMLEDGKTKPARAKKISDTRFELVLTEGRNRQIRRMCDTNGYQVKKLKRVRIMNVKLGELGEGNWRYLTKTEKRRLLELL